MQNDCISNTAGVIDFREEEFFWWQLVKWSIDSRRTMRISRFVYI
jgi:hypothetical protein